MVLRKVCTIYFGVCCIQVSQNTSIKSRLISSLSFVFHFSLYAFLITTKDSNEESLIFHITLDYFNVFRIFCLIINFYLGLNYSLSPQDFCLSYLHLFLSLSLIRSLISHKFIIVCSYASRK